MKLPISWLKEYAAVGTSSPEEIAESLLRVGFEVEEIAELGTDIKNVVSAKVVSVKNHYNSDHLHVCMVDVGNEILQIVCGAPNVEPGIIVPCALNGATLPGGLEIKTGEIRGIRSYGMLCSGAELKLDDTVIEGAEVNGLLILPPSTPIGKDICEVLALHDFVLDVSVTANRPDCQSIVGLAREVAASMGVKFTPPSLKYKAFPIEDGQYFPDIQIKSSICSRYTGRLIKNVKIESSPKWMRDRLRMVGIRPINNIVDITNYVLIEIGQPLHAFDLRFISEGIIVRTALDGEKITALDGKEHILDSSMLVIADHEKPVAIAGVMGGEYSGIMEDTADVFLEAANFERSSIRVTSRKIGLRSDSSARYEKGVDYQSVDSGRERALALISQLKAGKVIDFSSNRGIMAPRPRVIQTSVEQINSILGIDVKKTQIIKILKNLQFNVESPASSSELSVTVPMFREDVEDFADLSEEVVRYTGYDNLKSTFFPTASFTKGGYDDNEKKMRDIKNILTGFGAYECLNYSFINENAFNLLKLKKTDKRRNALKLCNPLNEDTAVMRTLMSHSMLSTMALNLARGNEDFRLFELGRIYIPGQTDALPEERYVLSIGLTGKDEDYYSLKKIVDTVFAYFRIEPNVNYSEQPFLHSGKSADAVISKDVIASYGEVHPVVAESYNLNKDCYYGEIDITYLLSLKSEEIKFKPISKFPRVTRDIAVIVNDSVKVGDVISLLKSVCSDSLEDATLFDVYKGKQIEEGSKSLAFELKFRSVEKTLSDTEINEMMDKALNALKKNYGAKIRQ